MPLSRRNNDEMDGGCFLGKTQGSGRHFLLTLKICKIGTKRQ